ncbi:RNA polymerase sigma factor [Candidatus Methylospira mobilis]|uniref:RNA polymerase sigma factor n=1 Tax=Candidatus Methylospira mobilis TaxID=1808979 RepID=A0A5Q0BLI6_9GAMM|nr:RNA polymerase sigma factor [Candidatus Methylospira mobilis]QFY43084.1 RNA polymerase sigma factor [Candidatus Methylospira mobilis]
MSDHKRCFLHDAFLRHAREMTAFIRGRWPGETDVDDIVQESFLRLSQCPDPMAIQNPRAYLFQIASNLVVDQHRRHITRNELAEPDIELESLPDTSMCPARRWETQSDLDRFTELLDQLPEVRRHAFVLFRIEGLSHAEIAVRLGIAVRTSERHVMKATQHIAKHLESVDCL